MSIGETLAAARLQAGLTVDRVSEATRIRQTIVEAIERDDFSRSGGDFYARAQIRTIAGVVGADPGPLLAEFDADREDPSTRAIRSLQADTYTVKKRRSGPNWSAAMAGALVLVLVYGVFQLVSQGGDGDGRSPSAGPTATRTSSPEPTATSTPDGGGGGGGPGRQSGSGGPVAQAPRGEVRVKLSLTGGPSWLSVSDRSGERLFQGLLEEGARRTFTDKRRLALVVGNAGAVRLTVNGERLGSPGQEGEVVRLEFDRDGAIAG